MLPLFGFAPPLPQTQSPGLSSFEPWVKPLSELSSVTIVGVMFVQSIGPPPGLSTKLPSTSNPRLEPPPTCTATATPPRLARTTTDVRSAARRVPNSRLRICVVTPVGVIWDSFSFCVAAWAKRR
jgi:hypothetical protein